MRKILVVGAILALAGCTSSAERMYQCESQGISRDACYVAEQNRKATINSAAQKQAMENANDLYGAKGTETNKHRHHRKHHETDYDDYDSDE
ncbi:hypothetical protein DOC35_19325 [Salmonella enterica subsp. enterica]|nr:hypothetical protein [Salmonella enterica subsp. enterica]